MYIWALALEQKSVHVSFREPPYAKCKEKKLKSRPPPNGGKGGKGSKGKGGGGQPPKPGRKEEEENIR